LPSIFTFLLSLYLTFFKLALAFDEKTAFYQELRAGPNIYLPSTGFAPKDDADHGMRVSLPRAAKMCFSLVTNFRDLFGVFSTRIVEWL